MCYDLYEIQPRMGVFNYNFDIRNISSWVGFVGSHWEDNKSWKGLCNGGVCNNTKWAGSSPLPFVVGNVATTTITIKCKVCHFIHVYIALCHAQILYIHSTSVGMSMACTIHKITLTQIET